MVGRNHLVLQLLPKPAWTAAHRAGFKAHSCLYIKPLKDQNTLCQKPQWWPTPKLPEQRFFSPNELCVQQTIHFDQWVTSDITGMAELSQQQKSHEEREDTQSLLYAQPLVSEINKLQTLVNRSLFKTQTSSPKDLHLLNLSALLSRAVHRVTGYPQTVRQHSSQKG